jgi:hypothetical protein
MHRPSDSAFFVLCLPKDRKEAATDLKMIYQAPTLDEADY